MILEVDSTATARQIELLQIMHPNAIIVVEGSKEAQEDYIDKPTIIRNMGVAKGRYMMENKVIVVDIRTKSVEGDVITFSILEKGKSEYVDYKY